MHEAFRNASFSPSAKLAIYRLVSTANSIFHIPPGWICARAGVTKMVGCRIPLLSASSASLLSLSIISTSIVKGDWTSSSKDRASQIAQIKECVVNLEAAKAGGKLHESP